MSRGKLGTLLQLEGWNAGMLEKSVLANGSERKQQYWGDGLAQALRRY